MRIKARKGETSDKDEGESLSDREDGKEGDGKEGITKGRRTVVVSTTVVFIGDAILLPTIPCPSASTQSMEGT